MAHETTAAPESNDGVGALDEPACGCVRCCSGPLSAVPFLSVRAWPPLAETVAPNYRHRHHRQCRKDDHQGSCSADILASLARTYRTLGNQNANLQVALNLLRVRPWHRFAVIEVGIGKPGDMQQLARMVRPDIGIIVAVARVHTRGFPDHGQYTAEKALFLEHLSPAGLAILNGDDPQVSAMADPSRSNVLRFGTASGLQLWADEVSSRWPDRLSFRVHRDGESCDVRTQLIGSHWVPSLLAALAAAGHLGIGLGEAAEALGSMQPYTARLEPVFLPNGAVIVRDDYSASIDTFNAALKFLQEARALRRVLVTTGFTDSGMSSRGRWLFLGAAASGWLDLLVLIGHSHAYGRRKAIEAGMSPESVHGFETLQPAARLLRAELKSGDLVLLKGRTTDHVTRLFFALIGSVSCWRDHCPKTMLCDGCWELGFHPEGEFVPPSVGVRA